MGMDMKGAGDVLTRLMMRQTERTLLVVLVEMEVLRDASMELHAYDGLCSACDLLAKIVSRFQANMPDPQQKPTHEQIKAGMRAGE